MDIILLLWLSGRENMLFVTNLEESEHVVHHCWVVDRLVFSLLRLPETDRTTCMFKGIVSWGKIYIFDMNRPKKEPSNKKG